MTLNNVELELLRMVSNALQRRLLELHTALPGIVEKHYPEKGSADIKIAIKRQISEDLTTESVQVIPEVPIIENRTSKGSNYTPLNPGDQVLLIFCERNLDNFKIQGGTVEPAEVPRFFDYTDAVAIPGFYQQSEFADQFTDNKKTTSRFIEFAGGFLGIDEDGNIFIGRTDGTINEPLVLGNVLTEALTSFSDNVISLLDQTKQIASDISDGPIGIGNLGSDVPTHPALVVKLQAIITNLDALKSSFGTDKSKYLENESTNIISQKYFTERGV